MATSQRAGAEGMVSANIGAHCAPSCACALDDLETSPCGDGRGAGSVTMAPATRAPKGSMAASQAGSPSPFSTTHRHGPQSLQPADAARKELHEPLLRAGELHRQRRGG